MPDRGFQLDDFGPRLRTELGTQIFIQLKGTDIRLVGNLIGMLQNDLHGRQSDSHWQKVGKKHLGLLRI